MYYYINEYNEWLGYKGKTDSKKKKRYIDRNIYLDSQF